MSLGLLVLWTGVAAGQVDQIKPPPPEPYASQMEEFWRRGACLLGDVELPALRAAATPAHPEGLALLTPRTYDAVERLTAWTRVGDRLYAASDGAVYEVDLQAVQAGRRWSAADGLLDSPVVALVPDGARLWVVTRAGLSVIDLAGGGASAEGLPRFTVAAVVPGPNAVWVLSDTGACVLPRDELRWRLGQPMPTAERIAGVVRKGLWSARWRSATAALVRQALWHADAVWVVSLGALLRLDARTGDWRTVSDDAWEVAPDGDALWVLSARGVGRVGADGATLTFPAAGDVPQGRPSAIRVREEGVWVLTTPVWSGTAFSGGGLFRWDRTRERWQAHHTVGGLPTQFASSLGERDGRLWVATRIYDGFVTKRAHPGMMLSVRSTPRVTGIGLAEYDAAGNLWRTQVIPAPKSRRRYVLGQRGTESADVLGPEEVLELASAGGATVAVLREFPERYFGGYLATVARLAHGRQPELVDQSVELGLLGEQPDVLTLSNTHGERVVLAAGQDDVLGLVSTADAVWVVTERRIARLAGEWQTVLSTPRRFYWTVTAAAVTPEAVWLGADRGTIGRFDRKTHAFTLVAVAPEARIAALAVDSLGRLRVRTEPLPAGRLPIDLAAAPQTPAGADLTYDGARWWPTPPNAPWPPEAGPRPWTAGVQPNIVTAGGEGDTHRPLMGAEAAPRRSAYLLGLYQPKILCHESENVVWLATYEGIARADLSEAGGMDEATLLNALASSDAAKRLWAVRAAGNIGDTRWQKPLADLLRDPDPTVRRETMAALRRFATADVADRILAVLTDPDVVVRQGAIVLAGRFQLKAAVPQLIAYLKDRNVEVQASAALALGRIGDPRARPALEALTDDPRESLRSVATKALVDLRQRRLSPEALGLPPQAAPEPHAEH
jgi:hypothetical protein